MPCWIKRNSCNFRFAANSSFAWV